MDESADINSTVAARISEAEDALLVSKQCQQNGLLSEVRVMQPNAIPDL